MYKIILEPNASIRAKILAGMAKKTSRISEQAILAAFSTRLNDAIRSTPTYQSLISNSPIDLSADFGFIKGQEFARVNPIVNNVVDSLKVTRRDRIGRRIASTKIRVFGVPLDHNDILFDDNAFVRSNQYLVPWLEWLLLRGDKTVIDNFKIERGTRAAEKGRSRNAIMVIGDGFAVQSRFAGVQGDNFLTDAVKDVFADPSMTNLIVSEIRKTARTI